MKNGRLDQPAAPMVYLPHAQHPASYMALVVRTAGDPAAAQGTAADAVRQADKTLVPLEMEPMESRVAASRGDQRFRAVLLGMFAGSAFFLAIVGLYAVVSYATHIRRHEIGVRVALGASARDIVGMVVRDGMRPVLVGLALGSAGAAALSGLMRTLVFGVRPFEPAIVAGWPRASRWRRSPRAWCRPGGRPPSTRRAPSGRSRTTRARLPVRATVEGEAFLDN